MSQLFVLFLYFNLFWSIFGFIIGISLVFSSRKNKNESEAKRGKIKILTTLFPFIISGLCLRFINPETVNSLMMVLIAVILLMPELISIVYFKSNKLLATNN